MCAEALSNITKHAGASLVSVTVGFEGRAVVVAVTDDGIGGADPAQGTGLAGLADRVAALGGRLRAGPAAGGGTLLTAEIPADLPNRPNPSIPPKSK